MHKQKWVCIACNLMVMCPDQGLGRESPVRIPSHAIEQALVIRKFEQRDIPEVLWLIEGHFSSKT